MFHPGEPGFTLAPVTVDVQLLQKKVVARRNARVGLAVTKIHELPRAATRVTAMNPRSKVGVELVSPFGCILEDEGFQEFLVPERAEGFFGPGDR